MAAAEFEDGVAATGLLPGPASTQLAIFCAWRLRGRTGALVGGVCFIGPGLVLILALAALFLAAHPPVWVEGAAAGAGAAVPAVAVRAAASLAPASWTRAKASRAAQARWVAYVLAGGLAAATIGPFLVLVLAGSGVTEVAFRGHLRPRSKRGGSLNASLGLVPILARVGGTAVAGGLLSLVWVAFKVGALSYGGGFVIVPLMQHDAVSTYHWMTNAQFLYAVALGQVTPGPVVQTVAVVGYAASGIGGGLLAALVAFTPSFAFVIFGGRHFDRLRANDRVQSFLTGAGAAAIGAIAGSAVPLGLALGRLWQVGILVGVVIWLLVLRRNVVIGIVAAGVVGVIAAVFGAPVPH
jgi:chromate transporter